MQDIVKANTSTKPVNHAAKGITKTGRTQRRAVRPKASNSDTPNWRRYAGRMAVTSVVAAACGFIAIRAVGVFKRAARDHDDWKSMDAKLDSSLEHAGNTSEPTATY